jgi:DnaK suppressor protein
MAKGTIQNADGMLKLPPKKKKYYDALMEIREQIARQMEFHSSEALANNHNAGEKGMSTHMADLGSDNFLHDMELNMITQEGDVLETIDEAVERLISGDDYGICQDCGCDIGEERLMVKPYASFCVKCKAIREKNGGMRPDFD